MRLGIGPFFLPMAGDLGFSRSLLATIVAVGMLCYGRAMRGSATAGSGAAMQARHHAFCHRASE